MRRFLKRLLAPTSSSLMVVLIMCSGCASLKTGANKVANNFKRGKSAAESNEDPLDPLGARNANRLMLEDLAPGQIGTTLKTRFVSGESQTAAESSYDQGKQLYEQGTQAIGANPDGEQHEEYFINAANKFKTAGALWPDSSLAEDAFFYEGESYFFANRYVQANRAYEGLISQYSGTRYLDRAEQRRYAIAIYWLDLKKSGASMVSLNNATRPKFGSGGRSEANFTPYPYRRSLGEVG